MQVKPSIQNKPLYPTVSIIIPPKAGPKENPKLIASLIRVSDLVSLPGLQQIWQV